MKLPGTSLLMTVLLRLFCIHARAVMVTPVHGRAGHRTVTADWNSKRVPASTNQLIIGANAFDDSAQVTVARSAARPPISANDCPAAMSRSPMCVLADEDSVAAKVLIEESSAGIRRSPPILGATGGSAASAFGGDALIEEIYRAQFVFRPIQSGRINLCGIPADAILSAIPSTGSSPQRFPLVLVL